MSKIEVNEKRVVDEFQELTAIDAPSFGEREMADRLIPKLKELGFEVEEDNAGEHFGGNAGNLYAYLPGDLPGDPILLSGHMDTVEPSKGKKGIIGEDGVIRSAGKAVLGADDVAGLVEILEGIRSVKEAGVPHRDIEILFAIAEELYIKGSSVFDFSKVRAKEAYVLDISGPVGSAAYGARHSCDRYCIRSDLTDQSGTCGRRDNLQYRIDRRWERNEYCSGKMYRKGRNPELFP